MKFLALVLISSQLAFATAAAASTFVAEKGEVKFLATGKPGFLKIRGHSNGKGPTGKITIADGAASGEFTFDVASLDTGIGLRNDHMKDTYLEVKKYPSAQIKIDRLAVSEAEIKSGFNKDFVGKLTLHGVTKEVKGKLSFDSGKSSVNASFEVLVSDFQIDIPKYMGVTVSEKVAIEVATNLALK